MRMPAVSMNAVIWLIISVMVVQAEKPAWRMAVSGGGDGQHGIHLLDSDGSNAQRITNHEFDLLPKWSPDGQRIAFLGLREQDYALAEVHNLAFHWYLYTMDADGQRQTRVTDTPVSGLFQWSPDGNTFLFESSWEDPANRGIDGAVSSAIYVMQVDGTDLKRLTPVEGLDSSPVWSPDGSQIAFCSNRNGSMDIFVMRVDGTDVRRLTSDPASDTSPIWSPDGSQIAFMSNRRRENGGVYLIKTDGSGEQQIAEAGSPAAWSPDGNQFLLFNDDRSFIVDVDGENLRQLTSDDGRALDEQFSPDGSRVFYRWHAAEHQELWSVGTDGQNRQKHFEMPSLSGFSITPHSSGR